MDKKTYNKEYYKKNKLLMKARTIKNKREALNVYKELQGCEKCGFNTDGVALDFHHRDERKKSFSISQALKLPFRELKREIRKCTILCANHHRIEHYSKKIA